MNYEHLGIYEAIKKHDSAEAKERMLEHHTGVEKEMLQDF